MKTKFKDFLNESVSSILDNTTLGKTKFEYNGEVCRLVSYLYVYQTIGGEIRYAAVNKEDANAVSGSGGHIVYLKDVNFVEEQTPWSDDRIKEIMKSFNNRVKNDKKKYEYLKSLPLGLTEEEYDEYSINFAVDGAMDYYENKVDLKSTTLGKTIFEYKNHQYRLDGYLFYYTTTDGVDMNAFVNKEDANGVTGYSTVGCSAKVEDIKILERETRWDEETLREEMESYQLHVKEDEGKLKFLKALSPNMSSEDIRKFAVKRAGDTFRKTHK